MIRRIRVWELLLLPFPVALLAAGLAQLALTRRGQVRPDDVVPAAVLAAILVATSAWLSWRAPEADQILLPIAATLSALGQLMVARLEPDLAQRQSLWVAIGLLAMAVVAASVRRLGQIRLYRYIWAGLGLLLVTSTFVLGVDPNGSGARLWLGFAGLYFQPSEILKILIVTFFASYLDDYRELLAYAGPRVGPLSLPPVPYLAPMAFMLVLCLLVLTLQRDLGAALLFYGIVLSMLYVASARASYIVLGLAAFSLGAGVLFRLFEHVRLRVDVWLDPWSMASTSGFQLVQGLTALAAGGLFGAGLGQGSPQYVPAVHTDFVIAAIGEELGLAGSLAVVALYLLMLDRGFRIALERGDSFEALLAAGLTSVVGIQSLVILGGALELMPLTGVTLPLLSYGGSSILANFIVVGLLLAISDDARRRIDAPFS